MCNVSYGIEKRVQKRTEEQTLVKTIKNLMKNLGVGIDQAKKLVEIPERDYPKYRSLVEG